MAIKGVAVVQNIGYSGNAGTVNVSFAYCSADGANNIDAGDTVEVAAGVGFTEAIRDYVQTALRTGGVTVTAVVDSIRVGSSLLPAT
jgi:hypothetical protein